MERLQYLLLLALLIFPIILMMLPADFFDGGNSICLSVLLFDVQCYGCGMTRALQHILHLDLKAAFALNPVSFLVFPVLGYIWYGQVTKVCSRIRLAQ